MFKGTWNVAMAKQSSPVLVKASTDLPPQFVILGSGSGDGCGVWIVGGVWLISARPLGIVVLSVSLTWKTQLPMMSVMVPVWPSPMMVTVVAFLQFFTLGDLVVFC